ncbi:nucleotide exchange factor GrpE [Actinomyces massiliensis]|uniref:nucleotide exchange factor GrpE n=1 Tax=Actinomyces massiliensis TaxID=461393 RepID=UPI0028E38FEC|nr:nucleotide exchange factor GrpE [Actinomyces massiliensis]
MSPEGTGREDGGDDERVDPALADAVESAFDGVVLDESGNPVAPAGAAGEAGGSEKAEKAGEAEAAGSPESESSEPSELERARAEAAQAADDLARARADLYNLQQEYQGFVRRSREGAASHRDAGAAGVVEALIPVLDEIELARQHGDLTGTFETTAGKLETVLADKFGLVRFGEAGETFDPTIHEALMATESDEVDEPSIAMVLQPGYRLGERIVRAARVQVANPA